MGLEKLTLSKTDTIAQTHEPSVYQKKYNYSCIVQVTSKVEFCLKIMVC